MFGDLITFLVGVLVMIFLIARRERPVSANFEAWLRGKKTLAVTAVIVIIVLAGLAQSLVTIQAGTVGVVKRLGAVTQDLPPGLHMIIPFVDTITVATGERTDRILARALDEGVNLHRVDERTLGIALATRAQITAAELAQRARALGRGAHGAPAFIAGFIAASAGGQ